MGYPYYEIQRLNDQRRHLKDWAKIWSTQLHERILQLWLEEREMHGLGPVEVEIVAGGAIKVTAARLGSQRSLGAASAVLSPEEYAHMVFTFFTAPWMLSVNGAKDTSKYVPMRDALIEYCAEED